VFTIPADEEFKTEKTLRVDAGKDFTLDTYQVTAEVIRNVKERRLAVVEGVLPKEPVVTESSNAPALKALKKKNTSKEEGDA